MVNLELFRELASVLATREKKQIGIVTDKGTVTATYDPLFKTVSFGGMTVPEKESGFWMKAAHGAAVKKIVGGGMSCKACTYYKGKVSLHKKDAAGKPRRHWVIVCHMIGYVEILPPKFAGICTAYAPPVGRANKNSGG